MEPKLRGALRRLLTSTIGDPEPGPVKWCPRCSRKHPARGGCGQVQLPVQAGSGRMVKRWVHPGH